MKLILCLFFAISSHDYYYADITTVVVDMVSSSQYTFTLPSTRCITMFTQTQQCFKIGGIFIHFNTHIMYLYSFQKHFKAKKDKTYIRLLHLLATETQIYNT